MKIKAEATKNVLQQTNVEDTENNVEYNSNETTIDKIKNSPFSITRTEKETFGTIGSYRVTERFSTIAEEEDYVKSVNEMTWERISQLIFVTAKRINQNTL